MSTVNSLIVINTISYVTAAVLEENRFSQNTLQGTDMIYVSPLVLQKWPCSVLLIESDKVIISCWGIDRLPSSYVLIFFQSEM